jgi:periplasmic protein TonB
MSFSRMLCCLILLPPIVMLGLDAPRKVSRSESITAALQKVQPEYPAIARQLNIEGTVELEALVSEDGSVEAVNIVSGNAALTKAASDALKKWKFAPFTTDGKAVKVLAPVAFDFKRQSGAR